MALIWRCASRVADQARTSDRQVIDKVLRETAEGWALPITAVPPRYTDTQTLAAWVRENAINIRRMK
jgi:hypothetical protein